MNTNPGRVVRALHLAGKELPDDIRGFQLLGQRGQLQTAAPALVFVHTMGDRNAGDPAGGAQGGHRAVACFHTLEIVVALHN